MAVDEPLLWQALQAAIDHAYCRGKMQFPDGGATPRIVLLKCYTNELGCNNDAWTLWMSDLIDGKVEGLWS